MSNNVEAPISIFNNIVNKITLDFEQILFENNPDYKFNKNNSLLAQNGKIIFNEKSIILMDFIKLSTINEKLTVKVLKPFLDKNDLSFINNLYVNWNNVYKLFYHYILMYNNIANGYDEVPIQLINEISTSIQKRQFNENEYFILPYKTKISCKYDKSKPYLENIFNRYTYVIKFNSLNKKDFQYKIIRILSNEFNQVKNDLRNLRFLETDIICTGEYEIQNADKFISKLFNYGELLKK